MRPPNGPNFTLLTLISPLLTNCWQQALPSLIFISRMDYSAISAIFVFLPVSVRSWFGKPIIVGWQGTLAWKRPWQSYISTSIGQNSDTMLVDIFGHALPVPSPNQPLRNRDCTHPYQLLTSHGSQFRWITCQASRPPSMAMTVFLWLLIGSQRWPFWLPARRPSQLRLLLSSSFSASVDSFWPPTNNYFQPG